MAAAVGVGVSLAGVVVGLRGESRRGPEPKPKPTTPEPVPPSNPITVADEDGLERASEEKEQPSQRRLVRSARANDLEPLRPTPAEGDERRLRVHGAGFASACRLFVADELGDTDIYDITTARRCGHGYWHGNETTFCAVTPSIGCAIAGTPFSDAHPNLVLIDADDGHVIARTRRTEGWRATTLAPDGTRAVIVRTCGHIEVWDLVVAPEPAVALSNYRLLPNLNSTGREASTPRSAWKLTREFVGDESITAIAVSPDGSRAVSGTSYGSIQLWDLEAGRFLEDELAGSVPHPTSRPRRSSWDRDRFAGPVLALAHASVRDCVAASSRNGRTYIRRYDPLTGISSEALETAAAASVVAFDTGGTRAISGTATGELDLWDLDAHTVRRLAETTSIESASFSPDGSRVVTTPLGAGPLVVWDFASGKVEQVIPIE